MLFLLSQWGSVRCVRHVQRGVSCARYDFMISDSKNEWCSYLPRLMTMPE